MKYVIDNQDYPTPVNVDEYIENLQKERISSTIGLINGEIRRAVKEGKNSIRLDDLYKLPYIKEVLEYFKSYGFEIGEAHHGNLCLNDMVPTINWKGSIYNWS